MRRYLPLLAVLVLLGSAAAAQALVSQSENLRVAVEAKISPRALPRQGAAPVSVSVGGQVSTTDGSLPPQLRLLKIEMNRKGRLEYRGLPVCRYTEIQPSTNERALAACRDSLVGEGSFDAYVRLGNQEPYPSHGRLLVFNGQQGGRQLLLGHIYISRPFTSSFIIPFQIERLGKSRFGTALVANLAKALGDRRSLTGIDLTLSRRYSFAGKRRSYLSAGCPAPKGLTKVLFPLVRTTFAFAGGKTVSSTLTSTCQARG
jgi:hypothetical protein